MTWASAVQTARCVTCNKNLPVAMFSKKQLKLAMGERRCADCIGAGRGRGVLGVKRKAKTDAQMTSAEKLERFVGTLLGSAAHRDDPAEALRTASLMFEMTDRTGCSGPAGDGTVPDFLRAIAPFVAQLAAQRDAVWSESTMQRTCECRRIVDAFFLVHPAKKPADVDAIERTDRVALATDATLPLAARKRHLFFNMLSVHDGRADGVSLALTADALRDGFRDVDDDDEHEEEEQAKEVAKVAKAPKSQRAVTQRNIHDFLTACEHRESSRS